MPKLVLLFFCSLIIAGCKTKHEPQPKIGPCNIAVGSDGVNALTGAAFICNSQISECKPVTFPALEKSKNEIFGVSVFSNQRWIFFGWLWRSTKVKKSGSVVRCNLQGQECKEIDSSYLKLKEDDSFGWNMGGNAQNLFISARTRNNTGVVFMCNTDGEDCIEKKPSYLGLKSEDQALFATSIHSTDDYVFIGSIGVDGGGQDRGEVYRCDKNLTQCTTIATPKGLKNIDRFGYAIGSTKKNIFISAIGKDQMKGSVFQCNLDGSSCELLSQEGFGLNVGDAFGAAFLTANDRLYISAVKSDDVRGSVYVCDLDGSQCKEKKAPFKQAPTSYFGSGLAVATCHSALSLDPSKD